MKSLLFVLLLAPLVSICGELKSLKIGDDAPESALHDITKITEVMTTTYDKYLEQKKDGGVKVGQVRDKYIYYAIDRNLCAGFPNGTSAFVTVTERYRAKIPTENK